MNNYTEADKKLILRGWFEQLPSRQKSTMMRFTSVDQEADLPEGSAKEFLEPVVNALNYVTAEKSDNFILFKEPPLRFERS